MRAPGHSGRMRQNLTSAKNRTPLADARGSETPIEFACRYRAPLTPASKNTSEAFQLMAISFVA